LAKGRVLNLPLQFYVLNQLQLVTNIRRLGFAVEVDRLVALRPQMGSEVWETIDDKHLLRLD
jgi:hypothetical protein